jgi:hypothetical protein
MVAVSLEAQQSSPPAPAWTGVVRTAAGEPVTGAKVTVFSAAAKEKITAVTGSDGRFAIADIRPGPHSVNLFQFGMVQQILPLNVNTIQEPLSAARGNEQMQLSNDRVRVPV